MLMQCQTGFVQIDGGYALFPVVLKGTECAVYEKMFWEKDHFRICS